MRRMLVAGNWKMNGSKEQARQLVSTLAGVVFEDTGVDVVVCPPALYLDSVSRLLEGCCIKLGAQNSSEYQAGAYTGELAAKMLLDFGCRYVILGHSERRALFLETDQQVAAKFEAAKEAGLTPILCVGETLEEREAGQTQEVVERQVEVVLSRVGAQGFSAAVVAYEPVWAIGTGKTATPEQAQEVHAAIRAQVAAVDMSVAKQLQIVYGGSMKAANAESLLAMADIDGGLVGGASLDPKEFLAICRAASC